MRYIKRSGKNYEVPDDYKKKKKEKWISKEEYELNPSGINKEAAEKLKKEALRKKEEMEREELRIEALRIREEKLKSIPLEVSRTDRNFPSKTNRSGQGKAHLTNEGLAPAGNTSISNLDQLDQDSLNKGTSNIISFTGPNPQNGGQAYGGNNAKRLFVKTRKIARAKEKGKLDAQHLEISTSNQLLSKPEIRFNRKFQSYVTKDDEHQIRVNNPNEGYDQIIPPRFIYGDDLENEHDSDSDSES
ncbi:hypothetical protein [Algoriphagus halophilus]|nr:hypothetical protein [Algoriphagus halophilus]